MRPHLLAVLIASTVGAGLGACGNSPEVGSPSGGGESGTGSSSGKGSQIAVGGLGSEDQGEQSLQLRVIGGQELVYRLGDPLSVLELVAYRAGQAVQASFQVDRADLASIETRADKSGALLLPTGLSGGTVRVSASSGAQSATVEIVIRIIGEQNGVNPLSAKQLDQLASTVAELNKDGGPGGVGGEGLGTSVTDEQKAALKSPSDDGAGKELRLVYPYNQTVFPRGLPAPLIAWDWSLPSADAIQLTLKTQDGNFSWTGRFAPPAILSPAGRNFTQHPIPQDIWEIATASAGGKANPLILELVVLAAGTAYGPVRQSWIIADARLSGRLYYNSYGTLLAKNYTGAVGGDGKFGGATLGIRIGDTGPKLVAGSDGDSTACRVCHSVSADGSRLVVPNQSSKSFSYALTPTSATGSNMSAYMEFPAVTPDGSHALAQSGLFYEMPEAKSPATVTGMSSLANNLGTPMFSPDGSKLALTPYSGALTNPRQKLLVADFDPAAPSVSNPLVVVDLSGSSSEVRPGWPAFLPDGKSLVYHQQLQAGADGSVADLRTRKGAQAQLYWTSASQAGTATRLNQLNGLDAEGNSYLPALRNAVTLSCTGDGTSVGGMLTKHESDALLNYEPTVNPVASGGYAWVVFTSRRRYANVATIPPYCSDPRGVNLVNNITPKKLWVAAVDLDAKSGEDPSHPAFYLPAQELLAGNSRGFWVLDPCRADGSSCDTGDQCCGGYCRSGEGGSLECGATTPDNSCSGLQEKCSSKADCCDSSHSCIGGFCSVPEPR